MEEVKTDNLDAEMNNDSEQMEEVEVQTYDVHMNDLDIEEVISDLMELKENQGGEPVTVTLADDLELKVHYEPGGEIVEDESEEEVTEENQGEEEQNE
jgi:hypothetical protein